MEFLRVRNGVKKRVPLHFAYCANLAVERSERSAVVDAVPECPKTVVCFRHRPVRRGYRARISRIVRILRRRCLILNREWKVPLLSSWDAEPDRLAPCPVSDAGVTAETEGVGLRKLEDFCLPRGEVFTIGGRQHAFAGTESELIAIGEKDHTSQLEIMQERTQFH